MLLCGGNEFNPYAEDNAAASKIVLKHGGVINDLYSLMRDVPASYHSDMTHFYTKKATQMMADQVIHCLELHGDLKAKPLDYDQLFASETKVIGI